MKVTLELKIKIIVYMMIFIILSLTISATYIFVKRVYSDDYIERVTSIVLRYGRNTGYYLEGYEKKANMIAHDRRIEEMINTNRYNSDINYLLTDMIRSYGDIFGISIYSGDFEYFSDKLIGNAPDKEFIMNNYIDEDFINSDEVMTWVAREAEGYKGFYYRSTYFAEKQGLYTLIYKLFDEERNIKGYLLLDTGINALFKRYSGDNDFVSDKSLYLYSKDGRFINYSGNKGNIKSETDYISNSDFNAFVKKNKIYLFQNIQNSDNKMCVCVPIKVLSGDINAVILILSLFAITAFAAAGYFGTFLVKSIINPINKLQDKIVNYSEKFENNDI